MSLSGDNILDFTECDIQGLNDTPFFFNCQVASESDSTVSTTSFSPANIPNLTDVNDNFGLASDVAVNSVRFLRDSGGSDDTCYLVVTPDGASWYSVELKKCTDP